MQLDELVAQVENRIGRLLPPSSPAEPLYGMVKYHLGWVDDRLRPSRSDTGKRIRPRLCLLTCRAAGSPPENSLAPSTAVELIHNFSLLHDDIQDRSEYRRHRRTVWALWGAAQAINAGDSTFALAQLALAEDADRDPRVVVRAFRALNEACRSLCEGQFLDLDFERRPGVSVEEYYAMIERKTAALLSTSCFLGALYGGAEENALESYGRFGRHLGLAFQIRDDYLGIWGDPKETGKPAADDVASKKKTLPLLYALDKSTGSDRVRMDAFLGNPDPAGESETAQILEILDRCEADAYLATRVSQESDRALEALGAARPQPEARVELAALCHKLTIRNR